ncbi:cell cycle checkpoint protein RAD1 isoform X2 [Petromyzon marinus]|uniref:cell cycle checkpoint protein RAD1 isoform X2 n=1 Tax=Petromyzon marinus TaxID=7757 RepID=UPI003F71298B
MASGGSAVLSATMDSARTLVSLLRAVHFRDHATFLATQHGLKATVEDSRTLQANAFVQTSLFHTYSLLENPVSFRVNLTALLSCLTMFGGSSSSTASSSSASSSSAVRGGAARTVGPPVALSLRYGGLRTQEPEDPLDFEFGGSDADEDRQTPNKVILKAEGLKEAFADLELSSSGAEVSVHITMSPARPHFRLSTFGPLGSTHCDFPRDSDMVESFHCTKAQTNRYKASFLKPSAKALSQASKVSVRMDWRGLLSLQFMIPNDGEVSFVEYYCCPDDVQEEEDDDDEVNSDDS